MRTSRRLLVLAVMAVALLAPAAAAAHPLGNFTVNRYSGIELAGDRIYVSYVLDMAEIPTFQERRRLADPDAYARRMARLIGSRLQLTVGGERRTLRPLRHALAFAPGVGGLRTMRLQVIYGTAAVAGDEAALPLIYQDGNFAGRIGWQEIVVRAREGARVLSSSVPSTSASRALRAYPKDRLTSPPTVSSARASFVPGSTAGEAPLLFSRSDLGARASVRATSDGGFAKLIAGEDLTAGVVLVALAVAFFWGAAHAFSPGHGKAIVAGYLIGSRGRPRDAVALGIIVTVTHTIGVFALGLVTLSLSEFVVPEQLYPWLNLVAALLVVAVGVTILRARLRAWKDVRDGGEHHHHHHSHDHDHGRPRREGGTRGLLGIGISAGILPCPTALVVLLAAISLHRVGYGLILILAFSVGLAFAVTSIGLVAVTAKRAFSRVSFEGRLVRSLPAVSAFVVFAVGLAMTARALPGVL